MTEDILEQIHKIPSMSTAVLKDVTLVRTENAVTVELITDKPFTPEDESAVKSIFRQYVPQMFALKLSIAKLTPDEDMVARRIYSVIPRCNRQIAAFIGDGDVAVQRTPDGFFFTIKVVSIGAYTNDFTECIVRDLKKHFCGNFSGKCIADASKAENIEIEEEHENIEYEIPVRTFKIADFTW